MAEKGFGVKEINLIGASGTPTIESPNNLNLNAVNVAISTNATIGGNLTVTGTVGIAGTLTYEDVTNIDSVGIITARSDLNVDGHTNLDNVSIVGVATVTGSNINIEGGSASLSQLKINSTGRYRGVQLDENGTRKAHFQHDATNNKTIVGTAEGTLQFNSGDTGRIILNSSGHWVPMLDSTYDLGINATRFRNVYADTLYGDGSNITGIAVTEAPVTDYTISANGSSAYRIHGGGVDETANSPDLYLIRGQKYRFNNTTGSGHPFAIRVSNGGSAYTDGVSGNNQGVQFFTVPLDAPASLVYQCTIHGGMIGNIFMSGGDGTHKIVADANPVMEFDRGSANNTNLNLKYNGTFTGQVSAANAAFELSAVGASTPISFYTNGSERLRITSGGSMKVGFINNTNPTTVFDVMASAINQDIVRFTGANYNRGLKISTAVSGSINDALIKYDADSQNNAGQHAFLTDGTERLRITSDGHVVPGANNTYDFGSTSLRWRNIYTTDLQLSNEGKSNDVDGTWGNYTIQEGESDLFLINNRSGKKYKFNLTEVS